MKIHLQEIRWKREYSIEQLSMLSGVSVSQISRVENGLSNPTIDVVCRLAKALGCTISDLVDCKE